MSEQHPRRPTMVPNIKAMIETLDDSTTIRLTARELRAAVAAAREEDRAPMEYGHPRACLIPDLDTRIRPPLFQCLACAREQRAVEKAVAQERIYWQRQGVEHKSLAVAQAEARVRRELGPCLRGEHTWVGPNPMMGATHCQVCAIERVRG